MAGLFGLLTGCMSDTPRTDQSPAPARDTASALTRSTAAALLNADTVDAVRGLDLITYYTYPIAPMSCDAWKAAVTARFPLHDALEREKLIAYRDSSAIGVDSVSHLCVESAPAQVQAWAHASHPPDITVSESAEEAGGDAPSRFDLTLRTARFVVDSITGILQAPQAIEATADVRLKVMNTRFGPPKVSPVPVRFMRARYRRYDDGWRIVALEDASRP